MNLKSCKSLSTHPYLPSSRSPSQSQFETPAPVPSLLHTAQMPNRSADPSFQLGSRRLRHCASGYSTSTGACADLHSLTLRFSPAFDRRLGVGSFQFPFRNSLASTCPLYPSLPICLPVCVSSVMFEIKCQCES